MLLGSQVGPILQTCLEWERAYGGCGLFLGANDGTKDLSLPLAEDRIRTFDYVTPFTPLELVPVTYYSDPLKAKYGEVATWRLTPLRATTGLRARPCHPSGDPREPDRSLRGQGHEPRTNSLQHPSWLGRFDLHHDPQSNRGLQRILCEPWDLDRGLRAADRQDEGSCAGRRRSGSPRKPVSSAVPPRSPLGRSNAKATIIDAEEEFERQSTVVTGLPDLLDRVTLRSAAAAEMPFVSCSMGQSPPGLAGAGSRADGHTSCVLRQHSSRRADQQVEEAASSPLPNSS